MTASNLPHALCGLLIIGVFLAWFFFCWQDYAVERGRHELMTLRDEWFDLVTSSSRWREEAACRAFLSVLEAQAKWIHKCSLPMVALALCMPRARQRSASLSIEAAIRGLPSEELRLQARRLQDAAALAIGRTIVKRSLAGLTLTLPWLPMALSAVYVVVAQQCVITKFTAITRANGPRLQGRGRWAG